MTRPPGPLRRAFTATLIATLLVQPAPSTHAAAGRGFLWKVEGHGGSGWLVGSLHVLTPDYYPLPASLEAAFSQAATVMEEIDYDEMASLETAQALASRAFYADGRTLASEVSPDTHRLIMERIARAGLPPELFTRMKPWMIALTLLAAELKRGGFDPAFGLDKHFHERAARDGKAVQALETIAAQLEFLEGLAPQLQESLVREQLEGADSELGQVQSIAAAWRAGDVAAIERVLLEPMRDAPQAYDALIVRRNRQWLPKIDACLAKGRCFIVVGAGHIVGPDGLVKMLKQRGYRLEQQ